MYHLQPASQANILRSIFKAPDSNANPINVKLANTFDNIKPCYAHSTKLAKQCQLSDTQNEVTDGKASVSFTRG